MRHIILLIIAGLLASASVSAQSDRDFSGSWKLNSSRSQINTSVPADSFFRVEQNALSLTLHMNSLEDDSPLTSIYPLDGRAEKRKAGDSVRNTETKWEGSALLVNTIVSGPRNYTVMERWKRSSDGRTLTIKRTLVRSGGESESMLVYENPLAGPAAQPTRTERSAPGPLLTRATPAAAVAPEPDSPPRQEQEYIVTAGTRVLLRLTNAVNTKQTGPGDRIYLETAVPVFVRGRVVIPAGSYVTGTVTESKRAGRVKGTSALSLEFDSLTLRNGVARNLHSRPGSVAAQGNLDRSEGRMKGESDKGGDAGKVAQTTAGGTGIGAIAGSAAGHTGMGAGIGAAAGAVAGLAGVLGTRGKDVVLPQGTTMEMVVNWDLRFTADELRTPNQ